MKKMLAIVAITAGMFWTPITSAQEHVHNPECFNSENLAHQREEVAKEDLTILQWLSSVVGDLLGAD